MRTGVTAVLPRKDIWFNGVYAATHTLNGDGEMTGTHWIRDRETLMHPILITNTGSVGDVHAAEIAYMNERHPTRDWAFLPVVAETWDGTLNDVRGRHVLLLDDILDTGQTLGYLVDHLRSLGATSVRVAVLLRKQGRQQVPLEPDYRTCREQ